MKIDTNIRVVTHEDFVVLHNISSGAWLKVNKNYYEALEIPEVVGERHAIPQADLEEFAEELGKRGYLANSKHREMPIAQNIRMAYLHITSSCNLSCKTCYFGPSAKGVSMGLEFSRNVIDLLAKAGAKSVVISGGEPLLHKNVVDICAYAKERSFTVSLVTNGILLTKEKANGLSPYVDSIAVSIDGDKISHERVRGEGTYDDAMAGILAAKEASFKKVTRVTTLHRQNIDSALSLIDDARALGIQQSFSLFMPVGVGQAHAEELTPSAEQCILFLIGLMSHGSATNTGLPEPIGFFSRTNCGAGRQIISIDPDGTIYPCHLARGRGLSMGNIHEIVDDLNETLRKSATYAILATRDVEFSPSCRSCEVRYFCAGGCIAPYLLQGKNDIHCRWYRAFYKTMIDCADQQLSASAFVEKAMHAFGDMTHE